MTATPGRCPVANRMITDEEIEVLDRAAALMADHSSSDEDTELADELDALTDTLRDRPALEGAHG